jgi:hypothetical protein
VAAEEHLNRAIEGVSHGTGDAVGKRTQRFRLNAHHIFANALHRSRNGSRKPSSVALLHKEDRRHGFSCFRTDPRPGGATIGAAGGWELYMAWNRWLLTVILVVAPAGSLAANCIKNQDHRSNKNSGVMVSEFLISGTQTLRSDQLNRFRANLIGACFDEDEKELQEQVRALFQNAGYFESEAEEPSYEAG